LFPYNGDIMLSSEWLNFTMQYAIEQFILYKLKGACYLYKTLL
jgi:hypothetical protein